MSLEWARARLLQHCEELRRLCEAQAAEYQLLRSSARDQRERAAVTALRREPVQRPDADRAKPGKVLKFARPGGRQRA